MGYSCINKGGTFKKEKGEEQKDIVRRMTSIEEGKISSDQRRADVDLTTKTGEIEEKKSSKKLYVIGGIIALVLVLGTVVYIKSKSK